MKKCNEFSTAIIALFRNRPALPYSWYLFSVRACVSYHMLADLALIAH